MVETVDPSPSSGVSLRCIVAMAAVVGSLGQGGCGADVERVAVAVQRSGDPCEATSRVRWPPPNNALISRACASHSTPTVLASETLTLELTCLDEHHGGSSSPDGPPPPTDPDPYVQCLSEEIF
jgi:hypothetical protein